MTCVYINVCMYLYIYMYVAQSLVQVWNMCMCPCDTYYPLHKHSIARSTRQRSLCRAQMGMSCWTCWAFFRLVGWCQRGLWSYSNKVGHLTPLIINLTLQKRWNSIHFYHVLPLQKTIYMVYMCACMFAASHLMWLDFIGTMARPLPLAPCCTRSSSKLYNTSHLDADVIQPSLPGRASVFARKIYKIETTPQRSIVWSILLEFLKMRPCATLKSARFGLRLVMWHSGALKLSRRCQNWFWSRIASRDAGPLNGLISRGGCTRGRGRYP